MVGKTLAAGTSHGRSLEEDRHGSDAAHITRAQHRGFRANDYGVGPERAAMVQPYEKVGRLRPVAY